MAYLERLYPGRISEACLIDRTGTEIARVVEGAVAPAEELSTEEASAPFFAPTFELPAGRVYQSAPYLSPDTSHWVVANSTPLVDAAGDAWALVHFEVTLSSFQPTASQEGQEIAIVDAAGGRALLRSGQPLDETEGVELGTVLPPELRALVASTSTTGVADGRRAVVDRVPAQPDNANSWAVVVTAPAERIGW